MAAEIVDRLADEVVTLARVALTRLDLTQEPVEVMLGGGLIHGRNERLLTAIDKGLREVGPSLTARATDSPPIVGAALLGLDALGADGAAQERLRVQLGEAVERCEAAPLPEEPDLPADAYRRSSDGGRTFSTGDAHLPRHRSPRCRTLSTSTSATAN